MAEPARIALRLDHPARLFHTLDPTPFREGDLAAEAEEYILDSAGDAPAEAALAVEVRLPAATLADPLAATIPSAIGGHFARRAEAETRAIRELLRGGRLALAIGLLILAACLALAFLLEHRYPDAATSFVLREGLVIVGWVALWRPAEIFLYDWLPHARRRKLYRRLAAATVTLLAEAQKG
jgi:MFS family permease